MITFGLTGGIACGKSTVSKTIIAEGIPIVDADLIARQIVEPGNFCWTAIKNVFGPEYFLPDQCLDRKKLGALIFGNQEKRFLLDSIMGPALTQESRKQIQFQLDQGHQVVGFDCALIIEMGHAHLYRPLIVVECQALTQIDRLMKRNGLTREEAVLRINAQIPVAQKVAMADYVINTDGTVDQSIEQTKTILKKICLWHY